MLLILKTEVCKFTSNIFEDQQTRKVHVNLRNSSNELGRVAEIGLVVVYLLAFPFIKPIPQVLDLFTRNHFGFFSRTVCLDSSLLL
jgi:hypothetical protein